jgi:hypothetical protein
VKRCQSTRQGGYLRDSGVVGTSGEFPVDEDACRKGDLSLEALVVELITEGGR